MIDNARFSVEIKESREIALLELYGKAPPLEGSSCLFLIPGRSLPCDYHVHRRTLCLVPEPTYKTVCGGRLVIPVLGQQS